jgi:uncharacterized protein (TIGR02594 family)
VQKILVILSFMSVVSLYAKVPIAISETMAFFVSDEPKLSKILRVVPKNDEQIVVNSFLHKKEKLAVIRSDMLEELYKNGMRDYHILGRVSGRAVLYFATKDKKRLSIEKAFSHRHISVGLLGDRAEQYLKGILKEKGILYNTNFISQDAYRSLSALRREEIDGFFLFASDSYQKMFAQYLVPYPEDMKGLLKTAEGLQCEDTLYCYASYYLVASDSLGKGVMENIYVQIEPFLSKNRELSSKLGKYYIYTGLKEEQVYKQVEESSSIDKYKLTEVKGKTKGLMFHRAPWMDLAIKEAMKGKGSAENVLPMLDLSYKYIRFAKGNRGITTAPNDSKEGAWCAAYICWTLNKSGYKIHSKGRMASQSFRYFNNKLYKKIEKPIFGAITLYTSMKNPARGHVGYLFGKTKNGRYILLGGNQSNRLKFADYPAQFGSYKLKGFYIPIDYKIKAEDSLTKKDIYNSADKLNKKYGINAGKHSNAVR